MKQYSNLKYAQREGSDVTLRCTIHAVYPAEKRGGVDVRILDITDGIMTAKLVVFGNQAQMPYKKGHSIVAGPVYYSDQYQNFSLKRGGFIHIQ